MRFRGAATLAKLKVFEGFLSTAVNCQRNVPESNTRQKEKKKKPTKNEEKIFRLRYAFVNYLVQHN